DSARGRLNGSGAAWCTESLPPEPVASKPPQRRRRITGKVGTRVVDSFAFETARSHVRNSAMIRRICMRASTLILCVTFLIGALPASRAEAANLLVNGSFETWSGGFTPGNQPDRIFNDGSLSVSGWNFAIGLS